MKQLIHNTFLPSCRFLSHYPKLDCQWTNRASKKQCCGSDSVFILFSEQLDPLWTNKSKVSVFWVYFKRVGLFFSSSEGFDPLTPVVFCPLLKKSLGNPYLKILDFSQLLVADTPMILFLQKFCSHPLTALLGHPVQK